jgi:threonine/homoserine efflux transporter RhtA
LGWLFLHEMPDCLSLIGYIIIIGASVTMFVLLRSHAKTSQN